MSNNTTQKLIVNALISKFQAQKDAAMAELAVMTTSAVGVSEHTSHVDDAAEIIRKLSEADECLTAISRTFIQQPEE